VLRTILADGPVPAKDAEREARSAGLSEATIRRARKAAGIRSERVGGIGRAGGWQWSLGAKALTETLRRSPSEIEHLSRLSSGEGDADPAPAPRRPDAAPAPTIDCADYHGHQLQHRMVGGVPRCDVCAGEVPA
jgi:hypothetical protein